MFVNMASRKCVIHLLPVDKFSEVQMLHKSKLNNCAFVYFPRTDTFDVYAQWDIVSPSLVNNTI